MSAAQRAALLVRPADVTAETDLDVLVYLAKKAVRAAETKARSKAPRVYGPRLTDKAFASVTQRWAAAVEYPNRWREQLIGRAAADTNRPASSVEAAWGIETK